MLRLASRFFLPGALGLALLLGGCSQPTAPATPKPAATPTVAAAASAAAPASQPAKGAANTITYSGNVQTKQQVAIVPKVSGRVTKLNVDLGSSVKAGDVLLEVDREALAAQVAQAEAALSGAQAKLSGLEAGPRTEQVAQAQANLDSAQRRLALLRKGGRAEQVAQAQANLDSAQAKADQVKKGATPHDLELARLAVEQAKDALYAAQTSRDGVCGNAMAPKFQCDSANAQIATAETAVNVAQTRYDQLKAGATTEQIAQADAAVTVAEQALKMAQQPVNPEDLQQASDAVAAAEAQLALVKKPVTDFDLQAAKAGVAQAKATVDLAKIQLNEATVKAPFDGVVSQRSVAIGAMVGPTAPVLSLISAESEVVINVEEGNLAAVKLDQTATLAVAAYPGQEFKATVTQIAPSLDSKSRTAQVHLTPSDDGGKLRDGMFAQVTLKLDGK